MLASVITDSILYSSKVVNAVGYDAETGFYYLNSRHYDPEIGRWINADSAIGQIGNVQGTNMFAYCFNNPINMSDPTGNWPKLSTIFAVVAVAAVAEKTVEKTAKRNNSVYVLKDDTGTVQYVGRTNDVDRRRAAHSANPARAGLEMEVIASGLNLPESRALEQAGMAYYHTINTANKMNNQINSVSPKYWGALADTQWNLGVLLPVVKEKALYWINKDCGIFMYQTIDISAKAQRKKL